MMDISAVNNYSRVARGQSRASVGFVGPDWNMIPHKGMPAPSQSELRERAKELGYAFVSANSERERQSIADEFFREVQVQYASHVAPDRKSIYEKAMDTIEKNAGFSTKADNGMDMTKTIFDYITEADFKRKGMEFDKAYSMAGGGSVTATMVSGGGAIFEIKDATGEPAMSIAAGCANNNGVFYYVTKPEQEANKEMGNIWQSAIDHARSLKATAFKPADGLNVQA